MKKTFSARLGRALLAAAWGAFWFCLFLLFEWVALAAVPRDFRALLTFLLLLPVVLLLPPSVLPEDKASLPAPRRAAEYLSLRPVSSRAAALSFVLGAAFQLFVSGTLMLLPLPAGMMENYAEASAPLADRSFTALLAVVLFTPLAEETTFRALMLGSFRRGMPAWLALPLSAGIFALCHTDPLWIAYAFVSGLLLGGVMLLWDSVLPSLLFHAAFNLTNYVRALLLPDPSRAGWGILLAAGLTVSGAAFALSLIGRKKERKEI